MDSTGTPSQNPSGNMIETPSKKKTSFRDNIHKIPEKARIMHTPTYEPGRFKVSGFKFTEKPDTTNLSRVAALKKLIESNTTNLVNAEAALGTISHEYGKMVTQKVNPHLFGKTSGDLDSLKTLFNNEQKEVRKISVDASKANTALLNAIPAKKSSIVRGFPELTEKRAMTKKTSYGFSNPMIIRREYAKYFLQKRFGLPEKQEETLKALIRTCVLSQELVKNLICLIAIRENGIIDKNHPDYFPGAYFLIPDDLYVLFPANVSSKIPEGRAAKYSTISSIISECIKDSHPSDEMIKILADFKSDPRRQQDLIAVNSYVKAPLDAFREVNPRSKKTRSRN